MNEATKQAVRAAFALHVNAEKLYTTTDGEVFTTEKDAVAHTWHLAKEDRAVEVVERVTYAFALDEAVDDGKAAKAISKANNPERESGSDDGKGTGGADAGASASGNDGAAHTGNGEADSATTNEAGSGGGEGGSDAAGAATATGGKNNKGKSGK